MHSSEVIRKYKNIYQVSKDNDMRTILPKNTFFCFKINMSGKYPDLLVKYISNK